MTQPADSRLFGFVLVALAILIGFVVTASNMRTCVGVTERKFVFKACFIVWLVVFGLLGFMYWLQPPYRYILLIPYLVVLPRMIYRFALQRQEIRQQELDERRLKAERSRSKT